jgi:hypothetical protein
MVTLEVNGPVPWSILLELARTLADGGYAVVKRGAWMLLLRGDRVAWLVTVERASPARLAELLTQATPTSTTITTDRGGWDIAGEGVVGDLPTIAECIAQADIDPSERPTVRPPRASNGAPSSENVVEETAT